MREPTHRSGALEQSVDHGRFVCPPPEVDLYAILDAVGRARPLEAYGNKRDFTQVGAQALAQLEDVLPRYAVPKLLKSVDTIPLLPTGKLLQGAARGEVVPAATDAERAVLACWQSVFPDSLTFGVTDNFADLGGHSLIAGRLVGKLREAFGRDFAMQAVFDRPTVREFAATLDGAEVTQKVSTHVKAVVAETAEVVAEDVRIPIAPGVELQGRIYRPENDSSRPGPVIVDFSPY